MKLSNRNLLLGITIVGSVLAFASSCRKEFPKNTTHSPKKYSLMSGTITVSQSWIDLRDKAKNEFDFYFSDYYHGRDFLKEVDWNQAILNEDNGQKIMVFLFKTDAIVKTDARLMVIQDGNGNNHYSVRIKSEEGGGYTSIYNANDKILTIGTIRNNIFEPVTQTPLKGTGIPGGSVCATCHNKNGDGDGGDDWGDPDGPGSINENNWLEDVVITGQSSVEPEYIPWPYYEGPWIVIPATPDANIDNDPCATFHNLMNNPAFRDKLQQLIGNTTLNHETAFTYNGTNFSPWTAGQAGVNQVTATIYPDDIVHGHSHYDGFGTFSPQDIYNLYQASQILNDPMGFTMVVATSGGGVSMIKITNLAQFNTFVNNYLPDGNIGNYNPLSGVYDWYQVGSGANASETLQNLLNATNAGLKVSKIPNPDQGANGSPCQ